MTEAKLAIDRAAPIDMAAQAVTTSPGLVRQWDWRTRVADYVSLLCSPPVVTSLGIGFMANQLASITAWNWALREWVLLVVLPALYVVWLVWRGCIADLDVRIRAQRTRPYQFTALGALLALAWSVTDGAPQPLVFFAAAAAAQVILLYLVTTRWKISLHSAAVASAGILVAAFAGAPGLLCLAVLPLVAWARVHLRRHTVAQTVAGALAGGAIYAVALLAIR